MKNQDIISEVERLLQCRYFLAERVYYYHTKLAADAMIIKVAKEASLTTDLLDRVTDDELLLYLRDKVKNPIAKSLASQIWERKLYRAVYMIDKEILEKQERCSVKEFSEECFGREKSCGLENKIIAKTDLKYEDVIIFCLPPDMNMKVANALIKAGKEPVRAKTLPGFKEINTKHEELWRLYVFAKSGVEELVAKRCKKVFGLTNRWNLKNRLARQLHY